MPVDYWSSLVPKWEGKTPRHAHGFLFFSGGGVWSS